MTQQTQSLFNLIEQGVSPFHVVNICKERLTKSGFIELNPTEKWNLECHKKYFISYYDSTLIAFTVGTDPLNSLRLAAAHTDFPCLKIKPNPDVRKPPYGLLNIEAYGGLIRHAWLDRPLSVAGKVITKGHTVFSPQIHLVNFEKAVAVIPEPAIHMNRTVNESASFNIQTNMLPLLTLLDKDTTDDFFLSALDNICHIEKDEILAYDLNLYPLIQPTYMGLNNEFIGSSRLDNLTSVDACVKALETSHPQGLSMICLFDNEEVGSRTKQGAASFIIPDLLRRIYVDLGYSEDTYTRQCASAFLLSVDVAHAYHPNYEEKNDITNYPVLNGGVVIKRASDQSYAGDAEAVAVITALAEEAKIPVQTFVNRADQRGGTTLGSLLSANLPVRTLDIGIPLLSMHSTFETAGSADQSHLISLLQAYFNKNI